MAFERRGGRRAYLELGFAGGLRRWRMWLVDWWMDEEGKEGTYGLRT